MNIIRNEAGEALSRGADSPIRFRLTTDAIDRHGTIVEPRGVDTGQWSGIILWGHDGYGGFFPPDADNVMGKAVGLVEVKKFKRSGDNWGRALETDVKFASDINPQAAMVEQFVRSGIVTGVSIGFRALEKPVMRDVGEKEIPVYEKTELLEASIVPIPSNPEATTLIKSMAGACGVQDRLERGWRYEDGQWYLRVNMDDRTDTVTMTDLAQVVKSLELPPPENKGAEIGSAAVRAMQSWVKANEVARAVRTALRERK